VPGMSPKFRSISGDPSPRTAPTCSNRRWPPVRGRVDVAVEIGRPDADARRRLFDLYSRGVPLDLSPEEVDRAVERMDGVTASFLKELIRRAVLVALHRDPAMQHVTGANLDLALDDLLDSTQSVTRVLLGVGDDDSGYDSVYPAADFGSAHPPSHPAVY
jgi:SpoVK/Ycf46/Vps4 family AAA+-type ATPase